MPLAPLHIFWHATKKGNKPITNEIDSFTIAQVKIRFFKPLPFG